jgi:phospholipid/cholesterol/gamma-HCH transport system permease protein
MPTPASNSRPSGLFRALDARALRVGLVALGLLESIRDFLRFTVGVLAQAPAAVRDWRPLRDQMYLVGVTSLPLVLFISVFSGAVAAWQAAYNFADYIPLRYSGSVVGKSVMLELGPVLTALVVAGRVGAAMAAELGTMAVTEQLDAMKVLDLNPRRFLLAPRLLAGLIILPLLTIFSSVVAILGALAVVMVFRDMPHQTFFFGVRLFYADWDLFVGLLKSVVFGGWIALFGCYFGFNSRRGAEGVGRAAMAAVVYADVAILVSGFVLSKMLLR